MIRLIPFHKKNIKIFFSLSFLILLSCSQDINKSNFYDLPFSNQTIFEEEIDFWNWAKDIDGSSIFRNIKTYSLLY